MIGDRKPGPRPGRAEGRRRAASAAAVVAIVATAALPALGLGAETVHREPEVVPVLGSKAFASPYGAGFGHPEPEVIFNGGDPSGEVSEIHWRSWGGASAIGYGREPIFKKGGGYYRKLARVELRAGKLGECGSKPAYTRLEIRAPKHPGGQLTKWRLWSGEKTICEAPR